MRNFTSKTNYILVFNPKRGNPLPFSWGYIKNQKAIHGQAFWNSAVKYFIYWSLCLFNFSRNVMNAHWKTQISKLLTLEVQHTMMNIIVLWYLHYRAQRSFWVSRHQTSWYFNWKRHFLFCTASIVGAR